MNFLDKLDNWLYKYQEEQLHFFWAFAFTTLAVWWMILAVILVVEQAFAGTSWLSETMIVPFIIFQLVSALKNASMAGFINAEILNKILDKIDGHKGNRQ